MTIDNDGGFRLSDEEKARIRQQVQRLDPDEEEKVRGEFGQKYGKVGAALLGSRFKVLRELAVNVTCLWEMLTDPEYDVRWQVKAGIVFALTYFISPIDFIPDTIPFAGYIDDALVVAYVMFLLAEDVAAYKAWRQEVGRPLPSV